MITRVRDLENKIFFELPGNDVRNTDSSKLRQCLNFKIENCKTQDLDAKRDIKKMTTYIPNG